MESKQATLSSSFGGLTIRNGMVAAARVSGDGTRRYSESNAVSGEESGRGMGAFVDPLTSKAPPCQEAIFNDLAVVSAAAKIAAHSTARARYEADGGVKPVAITQEGCTDKAVAASWASYIAKCLGDTTAAETTKKCVRELTYLLGPCWPAAGAAGGQRGMHNRSLSLTRLVLEGPGFLSAAATTNILRRAVDKWCRRRRDREAAGLRRAREALWDEHGDGSTSGESGEDDTGSDDDGPGTPRTNMGGAEIASLLGTGRLYQHPATGELESRPRAGTTECWRCGKPGGEIGKSRLRECGIVSSVRGESVVGTKERRAFVNIPNGAAVELQASVYAIIRTKLSGGSGNGKRARAGTSGNAGKKEELASTCFETGSVIAMVAGTVTESVRGDASVGGGTASKGGGSSATAAPGDSAVISLCAGGWDSTISGYEDGGGPTHPRLAVCIFKKGLNGNPGRVLGFFSLCISALRPISGLHHCPKLTCGRCLPAMARVKGAASFCGDILCCTQIALAEIGLIAVGTDFAGEFVTFR